MANDNTKYFPLVENKGFLYIKKDNKDSTTNETLWFISKNENRKNIEVISEAWNFSKNLGCQYNEEMTKSIEECEKNLFYKCGEKK